jgi:hypothetical protein
MKNAADIEHLKSKLNEDIDVYDYAGTGIQFRPYDKQRVF